MEKPCESWEILVKYCNGEINEIPEKDTEHLLKCKVCFLQRLKAMGLKVDWKDTRKTIAEENFELCESHLEQYELFWFEDSTTLEKVFKARIEWQQKWPWCQPTIIVPLKGSEVNKSFAEKLNEWLEQQYEEYQKTVEKAEK